MLAKAAGLDADQVFLDLEDAVPPAEKAAALEGAATALTVPATGAEAFRTELWLCHG